MAQAAAASGVEHGEVLLAFAETMVRDDDDALAHARQAVVQAMGPAAMVDTAGVASNFERMVRIADGTGIELGERMLALSQAVRTTLQMERFTAFKNT
jgi:uncharacterized membrane protein YcjF (UPF0283 family)